jgi:hypothetical protein
MIDPKLNELPVPKSAAGSTSDSASDTAERSKTRREGLSVQDTIAGDTRLSAGVPGVDTSGVRSGAGAGAGSSSLTAATTNSPAPNLVPGARETGMTTGGANTSGTGPTGRADTGVPGTGHTESSTAESDDANLAYEEVSTRAYQCWHERGCPHGSPDVDWKLAQEQLRRERQLQSRAASAS